MKRWIRKIIVGTAALLAVAVLSGAATEAVIRFQVRREFPVAGRLVEVGGRKLQLDCRGSGSPTVVLESGLDLTGSLSWSAVQDSMAATTRVCSYSRPGIIWSDRNKEPFSSARNATRLHDALERAGEKQPFVMVGHSIGSLYVARYTELYGADVAGIVLVDGSHPDQFERQEKAVGKSIKPPAALFSLGSKLSRTGLLRLLAGDVAPAGASADVSRIASAFAPVSLGAVVKEMDAFDSTFALSAVARNFGSRPLIVLSSDQPMPASDLKMMRMSEEQDRRRQAEWRALQAELATWSTNSRHEAYTDASHAIQFDRPDVVIRAVRDVVGATRGMTLTQR
jgi:pimeloyl-ACP methyl ester carboxylesterase